MKKQKRVLAVILAVIMMVTMLPSTVLASEPDGVHETESAVDADVSYGQETGKDMPAEEVPEQKTENDGVQEVQNKDDSEQIHDSMADPESEEDGNAEEPAEEDNKVSEGSEDKAEADQTDLITLKAEKDDYIVTISYDQAAEIPTDAEIRVKEVKVNHDHYDTYVERAAEAIDSEAKDIGYVKLLDISIVDSQDQKVDLKGHVVDVQISLKDVKEAEDTTQIVHFAGEEEVPEIIEPEVDGNTLAFETEGFSVYAVITGAGAVPELQRLAVNFYEQPLDPENPSQDQTPWKTMYVKRADLPASGEDLEGSRFNEILYDPGIPDLTSEHSENIEFKGWSETGSEADSLSIKGVRAHAKELLENGVTDGAQVSYYPVFRTAFRIYYENENGAVFHTSYYESQGNSFAATVDQTYEPATGAASFLNWKEKEGTKNYAVGDSITLTQNVTLTPVVRSGHWLKFNENAGLAGEGNADYTPPHFYYDGEHPAKPADPGRPGYKFEGWCTSAACVEDYPWNPDAVLEQDLTLYAHWSPKDDTKYTVVIHIQDIGDRYDATTKNYTYTASISKTGTTETTIDQDFINTLIQDGDVKAYTVASDLASTSRAYKYDHYTVKDGNNKDTDIIRGTGDTVINLYYNREIFTVTFYTNYRFDQTSNTSGDVYGRESVVGWFFNVSYRYFRIQYKKPNWYVYGTNTQYYGNRYVLVDLDPVTYTGLYGQSFAQYPGYTWPLPENQPLYYNNLVYLDAFVGNLFKNNALTVNFRSPGDTEIYFWNEQVDGSFKVSSSKYAYGGGRKTANLTNRFKGLYVGYWKWDADSSSMPDISTCHPFSDAEDVNGNPYTGTGAPFTSDQRPEGAYVYLHIINLREKHDLLFKYKDELGTVRDIGSVTGIPFEKPLSSYVSSLPSYSDIQDNYVPEGYYFEKDGWYLDEACTAKADLTKMEMGVADIPLYAKIVPYDMHVRVFKNGGTNDSLEDNFWVSHGEKLSESSFTSLTTKEGHSLIGWYKDEDFSENKRWVFDTPVTMDALSHVYTSINDPLRAGYPEDNPYPTTPKNYSDEGYDSTAGVLTLYAKWRDESGGFVIRYVKEGQGGSATETFTDEHRYSEDSDVVVSDFDSTRLSCDSDKQFDGWVLKEESYSPGTTIKAQEILANEQKETVDGRDVYVITFTARYVPKDDRTPTHIYWLYNDPERTGDGIFFYGKDEVLGINETVKVPYLNDQGKAEIIPERTGYKFLGWAKAGENLPTGLQTVTEANLFIKYNENDKTYDITQVFADEFQPYEALYAVWAEEIKFYIHHSSQTGSPEEVEWIENKEFNLVSEVADEFFYGGYGLYNEGQEVELVSYPSSDSDVRPGTRVIPEKNQHFYLREVSVNYLKPQIYITYYKNYKDPLITSIHGLVNIDDGKLYKRFVMTLKDKDGEHETDIEDTYSSIQLLYKEKDPEPVEFKNLFGTYFENHACTSALIDLGMDSREKKESITIGAYYVTQDNIRVRGLRLRDVNFGDLCFRGWTSDTGIKSSWKLYDGDDKVTDLNKPDTTEEPATPENSDAAGNPDTNENPDTAANPNALTSTPKRIRTLSRGLIQDKSSYINQYTVTKVIGTESEVQKVAEGSGTGQITYPEKPDAMFAGWYLDKACKNPADFSNVTGDMTVYAKYISKSDISFSLARTGGLIGNVPFEAAVSVKAAAKPDDIEVIFVKGSDTASAALTTTVKENIGTKKKPVYLYKHKGSVKLANTRISDEFTAQVIWTTPDGTRVEGQTYTVQYDKGNVLLQ